MTLNDLEWPFFVKYMQHGFLVQFWVHSGLGDPSFEPINRHNRSADLLRPTTAWTFPLKMDYKDEKITIGANMQKCGDIGF